MKDFRRLVAEKFPAGIENLHALLGCTKNRVTWLLNDEQPNYRKMSPEEIAHWAELLDVDRSTLIMEYHCGWDGPTLDELNILMRDEGMEIPGALPHVA